MSDTGEGILPGDTGALPSAAMSGNTLAETLLIRPGTSLFFSPIEWLRILGPLPPGVTISGEFAASTVAVVFVSNVPSVRAFLNRHRTVLAVPPVVWLCYPTRGRTDMNRASLLTVVGGHSLLAVDEVAVDATWSAMRVRPHGQGHPGPSAVR